MNYGQLRAAVTDWLHRADLDTSAITFVQLAESRLKRELRLNRLTASATLTILAGQSSVALPTDYLQGRSVVGTLEWDFKSPDILAQMAAAASTEYVYSIYGGNLVVPYVPAANVTVKVIYYQALVALANDSDTNWILTEHPGVYLWAALSEASTYTVDKGQTATFEGKFRDVMETLRQADEQSSHFAAALSLDYVV